MRKQAKILLEKSLDSLVLSIEHFNRPWDRGRQEAVLILLDHAFELFMKSAILHKGGRIRERYEHETIGFEKCVQKCIADAKVKCLSEEEGLTIQIINSFRDAAQHDIVELSEQELYLYSRAGVTLFKDLMMRVFQHDLRDYLPERVLPISTMPPRDLHSMIEVDFEDIKKLVAPGHRRQIAAKAKLKALAIVEASLGGQRSQPSDHEVTKLVQAVRSGLAWNQIFPGIASLELSTEGDGIDVDIRITKKGGDPVHLVKEGTPGATVLAVKRVNELDYYSMGLKKLSENLEMTTSRALALIRHLKLQDSDDYFKEVKVGKALFKRYSKPALDMLSSKKDKVDMDEVWDKNRPRRGSDDT